MPVSFSFCQADKAYVIQLYKMQNVAYWIALWLQKSSFINDSLG